MSANSLYKSSIRRALVIRPARPEWPSVAFPQGLVRGRVRPSSGGGDVRKADLIDYHYEDRALPMSSPPIPACRRAATVWNL